MKNVLFYNNVKFIITIISFSLNFDTIIILIKLIAFLSKMTINANVYRKDWEKNKNFLIFLMR
ncbi:hypothetical protein HpNP102_08660 [Helicobacter pylori]